MIPAMYHVLGRGHHQDTRNGDLQDPRTPDFPTDTTTLAEDWILREVPKLSMMHPGARLQDQELAHLHHWDPEAEVHLQDPSFES